MGVRLSDRTLLCHFDRGLPSGEIYAPNSTLPCHSERSEESSLVCANYIGLYRYKIHSLTLRMTEWLFQAHRSLRALRLVEMTGVGYALGRDDRL